jgi:RNA methyltransferase, TrmH family
VAEGIEVIRTALMAGCVPESLYVAGEGAPRSSGSARSGGSGRLARSARSDGGAAAAADGADDVADTTDASAGADTVAATTDAVNELATRAAELGARCYELGPGVMTRVADTVTPQPVMAVFPMVHVAAVPAGASLVVVMVDVRDPGNAGTVLRTADAAGVDAVVCCGGTVDPYNPKTVRSSAGSIFNVPIVLGEDAVTVLSRLGRLGGPSDTGASGASAMRRLGTVVRGGEDYAAIDWTIPTALVLGNEANGLPGTLPLDGTVGIPMAGRAESLNVGMACAVLCFEALRQRRSTMPR